MPRKNRAPAIDMTWITSSLCRSQPHVLKGIVAICESLLRSKEHGYVKRQWKSGQGTTAQTDDRRRPVKKREAVIVEKAAAPASVVETPVPTATATGEAAAHTTTRHPRPTPRRRRRKNAERREEAARSTATDADARASTPGGV